MKVNVENVHRWLIHIPSVAYGSLSQSSQWMSPVMQNKVSKVSFTNSELVSASVAASVKTVAFPKNENAVD